MQRLANCLDIVRREAPGLSLEQLAHLLALHEVPGLSVQDLADRQNAPQSTVSRQLRPLYTHRERRFKRSFGVVEIDASYTGTGSGYVEQRINEREPKKRALYLTEAGHRFLELIDPFNKIARGEPTK